MADYSLPLVDTLAQLQEPRVAVTAAHLFGSGCLKEANGWDGGNQGFALRCCRNANVNKYNFYSVYIIMTEMLFSSVYAGKLLEWSTAVSEKIRLDAWLMNFNLFANGCCSSPEIMEVIWPNHSTADTNTTNKHSKLGFFFSQFYIENLLRLLQKILSTLNLKLLQSVLSCNERRNKIFWKKVLLKRKKNWVVESELAGKSEEVRPSTNRTSFYPIQSEQPFNCKIKLWLRSLQSY